MVARGGIAMAERLTLDAMRCGACGLDVVGGAHFCQGCGEPSERAVVRPFDGKQSGARCRTCGVPLRESAAECGACGARALPRGAHALDSWLESPGGEPLWVVERHDATLRDRLHDRAEVRAVATHPTRARVSGHVLAELLGPVAATDPDPRALAEDLGPQVVLVEQAHRIADRDRDLLEQAAAHGARVVLRTSQAPTRGRVAQGEIAAADLPGALSARALEALDALSVLGPRASLSTLESLVERPSAVLRECAQAGVLTRRGDEVAFVDGDLADTLLARLDPVTRARLSDRALERYAADEAPLAVRAEVALGVGDVSTALLLLDMHVKSAIEDDELTAAMESLERGIERARRSPREGASAHVAAGFARTLAELRIRRGSPGLALRIVEDALGWIELPPSDRAELDVFRRGLTGRLAGLALDQVGSSYRAFAECDAELLRAAVVPEAEEAVSRVRAGWSALAVGQRLPYGTLLLAERVIAEIGRSRPEEAAELIDELLESGLTRTTRGLERLWRLRGRLTAA